MNLCSACDGSGKTEDHECRGCAGDRETGCCTCEPYSSWCPECDGSGREFADEAECEVIAEAHAERHPSDWDDVEMLSEMMALGHVDPSLWHAMVRLRRAAAEEEAGISADNGLIGQYGFALLMADIESATERAMCLDPRCPPRSTRPAQADAHKEVA